MKCRVWSDDEVKDLEAATDPVDPLVMPFKVMSEKERCIIAALVYAAGGKIFLSEPDMSPDHLKSLTLEARDTEHGRTFEVLKDGVRCYSRKEGRNYPH